MPKINASKSTPMIADSEDLTGSQGWGFSWAKPCIDEARTAVTRGEVVSLEDAIADIDVYPRNTAATTATDLKSTPIDLPAKFVTSFHNTASANERSANHLRSGGRSLRMPA
jgi:hypothetical protein